MNKKYELTTETKLIDGHTVGIVAIQAVLERRT